MTVAALLITLLLLLTHPAQRRPSSTFRPPPRPMMKTEEEVWLGKLMGVTLGNWGAIERGVTAKRRRFPPRRIPGDGPRRVSARPLTEPTRKKRRSAHFFTRRWVLAAAGSLTAES